MSDNNHNKTVTFPASRLATIDIGVAAFRKHHIRALFELDVTKARRKMVKLEIGGAKVSFNSWLIKCISEAITRYSLIHGVRSGKRKAVVFDDVDVSIMVERKLKWLTPHPPGRENYQSCRGLFA